MADGESLDGLTTGDVDSERSNWLNLKTRSGVLRLISLSGAIVLFGVVLLNFSPGWGIQLLQEPFLNTSSGWLWFGAATAIVWLPLTLLLLDSQDNMATGPSLGLPLVTLGYLALL